MLNGGVAWIHVELARWWQIELASDREQPPWRTSSAAGMFDPERTFALPWSSPARGGRGRSDAPDGGANRLPGW